MIVARRHGIWLAISAATIASAGFNNPVRADEQTEKALMEQLRIMQQRMDELSKEVKELKKGTGAAAARTGEVIGAAWSEIDLDKAVWTIPGDRMKAGREHKVPLSQPALAIFRAQHKATASQRASCSR